MVAAVVTRHQVHALSISHDESRGKVTLLLSETWWDGSHRDEVELTLTDLAHIVTNLHRLGKLEYYSELETEVNDV